MNNCLYVVYFIEGNHKQVASICGTEKCADRCVAEYMENAINNGIVRPYYIDKVYCSDFTLWVSELDEH